MTEYEDDESLRERIEENWGFNGFDVDGLGEDTELTPTDERLVEEISVRVVKRPPSSISEIARDFQRRLDYMRIESLSSVNRWQVRRLEHLYLTPFALEDVHYDVYQRRRQESKSPYVSISFKEIIANAVQDVPKLQRRQIFEAYFHLTGEIKIQDAIEVGDKKDVVERLFDWAAQGSAEQKYWLRSLSRLLKENSMKDLVAKLKQETKEGHTLVFEDVAARAVGKLDGIHRKHMELDTGSFTSDERMWHLLEARSLERARSFALPLHDLPSLKLNDNTI